MRWTIWSAFFSGWSASTALHAIATGRELLIASNVVMGLILMGFAVLFARDEASR